MNELINALSFFDKLALNFHSVIGLCRRPFMPHKSFNCCGFLFYHIILSFLLFSKINTASFIFCAHFGCNFTQILLLPPSASYNSTYPSTFQQFLLILLLSALIRTFFILTIIICFSLSVLVIDCISTHYLYVFLHLFLYVFFIVYCFAIELNLFTTSINLLMLLYLVIC